MWRVGRCSARLWGGTTPTPALGKAAPSLLPPPGNPPCQRKQSWTFPRAAPRHGLSRDLPLSDGTAALWKSLSTKGPLSTEGAAPGHGLPGTSWCPQRGQTHPGSPWAHPCPSHPPKGAVPAIPWQPHSWGLAQPQTKGSCSLFPLSLLGWSRHSKGTHAVPTGRAGASNSSTGLAGAGSSWSPGREGGRMEETESATCTCFHGERDNFSSRICQGNTQPGHQRAPLLHRDQLQDCVGPGMCPRGEMWNLHSGLKGISADPEGSVFCWVGGKGASVTEQGWSCWNRGKGPSHAHHGPPGESRDCSGQWEAEGDAGNELPQSQNFPSLPPQGPCCSTELLSPGAQTCPTL